MKKIIAILLAFIMAFGCCFAEPIATPTDLEESIEYVEIADDDFGHIENITPRVFIEMSPDHVSMYDEVTLTAILMDFPPEYTIFWQYSMDQEEWFIIENEHGYQYIFVLTPENYQYWWRVCVQIEG